MLVSEKTTLTGNRVNKEATPRAERSPPSTTRCLLLRPERLTQRLGQRSEDPLRGFFAGDVMRTVCQGRVVIWTVARGDVAIGLYYHRGVKFSIILPVTPSSPGESLPVRTGAIPNPTYATKKRASPDPGVRHHYPA
jgi:hypothetical protein